MIDRVSRPIEVSDQEVQRRLGAIYRLLLGLTAGADTHYAEEQDVIAERVRVDESATYPSARDVSSTINAGES
jgi:hypothetical protein